MGMEIDRLDIQIQAEASKASASLDKIVSQLGKVSSALTATNTSGLRNFSSGIKQLSSAMQSMSNVKTTDFTRLTKGIEKLGSINNSAIYKTGNSIRSFANSLDGISSVSDDAVKLGEIANGISKLGSVRIEKVTTVLPKLSVALKEFFTTLSTSPNVSENIVNMTNAMANLASNGAKFSSTINGLGRAAKTLSRSNEEVSGSFKTFGRSASNSSQSIYTLTHHINSLVGAYFSLKFVIGSVLDGIKKSMDFVETVNLFQTSYKKIGEEAAVKNGMAWGSKSADAYAKAFIDRAQTFNDKLVNSLGLDPNTMMNYQATFGQISNSLGLTSKTVENVSQSFTMLGNDIASLWNIDTKNAMEKLQSGLVGQTRPLRELGIDTTQASLQLTAYKYGIDESVKKMSQAEKVQLRWLTIMDQSSVAFGDMAKTINSPANQLRILKQQWDNLTRSIGNAFLPVVQTVLPYINAIVIALRTMIDTFATALGYKVPDYTNSKIYTDVTGGIDGMSDANDKEANSADKAAKANEKLKKSILGIDELNILSDNSSKSKSDSGSDVSGGGSPILDDAINKKTAAYMKKFNEQLEKMSNKSKELAQGITDFFKKIAQDAEPSAKALKNLWDNGLSKLATFTGKLAIDFYDKFLEPVGKWVLGKGIPGLADAMNNLLTAVDWDSLNEALGDLFDALSKMTIGIGQGLINFVKDLSKALKPALGTTSKLLADAIKSIADSLKNVDAKTWEDAGYAIGVIATATAGIKIVSGLPAFLISVGNGLESIATALSNLAYMNPVALPALFDMLGLNDWLDDLYNKLPQWCRDVWEGIWAGLARALNDVFNWDKTVALVDEMKTYFKKAFDGKKKAWTEIGKNIALGIVDAIAVPFSVILEPINDLIADLIKAIKEVFGIHSPSTKMKPYGKYITQGLLLGITEGWTEKWDEFKTWLSGLPEKIAKGFGTLKEAFETKGGQIISGIKQGWSDGWNDFKDWLGNIPEKIAKGIGSLYDIGKNLIQSFINGLASIKIPKLDIDFGTKKTNILGKEISVPTLDVKLRAVGGFPDMGEMFVAREAGPELVGRIGKSNAVVNNDQIVQSVSSGVANAVAETIIPVLLSNGSSSGGNTTVRVPIYIGKEQIAEAVLDGINKRNRRFQTSVALT